MNSDVLNGIRYYATRIRHAKDDQLAGWVDFARSEVYACRAARDMTGVELERTEELFNNAATYRRAELMRELIE